MDIPRTEPFLLGGHSDFYNGSHQKIAVYDNDTEFRRGAVAFSLTPQFVPDHTWLDYAVILAKPCAIVRRKLNIIRGWLDVNDFDVVTAKPIMLTTAAQSLLWRYQWNVATFERIFLSTLIGNAGGSLLLVVKQRCRGSLPATVRLARLKGRSDRLQQFPDTLRANLQCPSKIFGHIHASDSLADIIREFEIVLGGTKAALLWRFLECAKVISKTEFNQVSEQMYRGSPSHELDPEASELALGKFLRSYSAGKYVDLLRAIISAELPGNFDWIALAALLDCCEITTRWDILTVLAAKIPLNRPHGETLLPSVSAQHAEEAPASPGISLGIRKMKSAPHAVRMEKHIEC